MFYSSKSYRYVIGNDVNHISDVSNRVISVFRRTNW